jgi:hypothetical protein
VASRTISLVIRVVADGNCDQTTRMEIILCREHVRRVGDAGLSGERTLSPGVIFRYLLKSPFGWGAYDLPGNDSSGITTFTALAICSAIEF